MRLKRANGEGSISRRSNGSWVAAVSLPNGRRKFFYAKSRDEARRKLTNVTPVLGTQDDPRLPIEALDLVLMVDVYHELSQPQLMLRHIKASLKPGGRLALVEYRKEDPNVPIRPEHKMSVAEAKLEVEAEGFKLTTTNEDLPRQHILIFRKQ